MPRSANAQLAVDLYRALHAQYQWTAATAWHGIARLLLTCDVWDSGWKPFHNVVVYREKNDFRMDRSGNPGAVLRRAGDLTDYLSSQLGIPRAQLCNDIGQYYRQPPIANLQPHNVVGHAFRSLIVTILEMFGDPAVQYDEEADPHAAFPGFPFVTRSPEARVDITARRNGLLVAILSTRWRYRHDRVDLVDEARTYAPAAQHQNPNCKLYAVVGEFAPNRLHKVLSNCPPALSNAALTACVHFAPQLLTQGLKENGRVQCLQSLDWLIQQTHTWK